MADPYNINETKLNLLINASNEGREITKESVAEILAIKTPKAIKAYLEAFIVSSTKEIQNQEDTVQTVQGIDMDVSPVPVVKDETKKTFAPKSKIEEKLDLSGFTVILEEDGIEKEEFEVVSNTKTAIIINRIVPISKSIMIDGDLKTVDLRKLRAMNPDAELYGTKVSNLIILAELA